MKTRDFFRSLVVVAALINFASCESIEDIFGDGSQEETTDTLEEDTSTEWGGSGTQIDPYTLGNRTHMDLLSQRSEDQNYAGVYFEMTRNIDLGGFDSDGNGVEENQFTPISEFKGHFDGGGYQISGLYSTDGGECFGLFTILSEATVQNLTLSGYIQGVKSVGGVAGSATDSSIINCHNMCSVIGYSASVGGVVGAGSYLYISECSNSGEIYGGGDGTGGIAGGVSSSTIELCYNVGEVRGTGLNNGGIAGSTSLAYSGTISSLNQCYNIAAVSGGSQTGGIVGINSTPWGGTSSITNCYSRGDVEGYSCVGGVIGLATCSNADATISGCYAAGSVTGSSYVGGFAGGNTAYMSSTNRFESCYWDVDVAAMDGCGTTGSDVATAMSTAEMKSSSFVTTLNAYSNLWSADSEPQINEGYPILSWQL